MVDGGCNVDASKSIETVSPSNLIEVHAPRMAVKERHPHTVSDQFDRLADRATAWLGTAPVLIASVVLVIGWLCTGPLFGFSDTWQLFINTTTTVITFWMVFVIQNSANRQSKTVALKLDEVIRVLREARNEFVDLDHATEAEIAQHESEFEDLAKGSS